MKSLRFAARNIGKRISHLIDYCHVVLREGRQPFDIYSHMTVEERLLLYRLAKTLPARCNVVEVGSYLGASSCFLAAGVRSKCGRVFSVDTWMNDAMSEGKRDTYSAFLENVDRYKDLIVPIRSESKIAAKDFAHNIDMLFVDAGHDYESVKSDLDSWLPKVRPQGWVVMHDWGWAEGVQRAVKECLMPILAGNPQTLPNLFAARVNVHHV